VSYTRIIKQTAISQKPTYARYMHLAYTGMPKAFVLLFSMYVRVSLARAVHIGILTLAKKKDPPS
jgi:hypothetical protein